MPIKKIMANSLIKALIVIKYKYFIRMTEIKDKKELLASIKQENNLKDVF